MRTLYIYDLHRTFQSLVYWKGGDKSFREYYPCACVVSFNPWFIGRVGINLWPSGRAEKVHGVSILGLLEGWG